MKDIIKQGLIVHGVVLISATVYVLIVITLIPEYAASIGLLHLLMLIMHVGAIGKFWIVEVPNR